MSTDQTTPVGETLVTAPGEFTGTIAGVEFTAGTATTSNVDALAWFRLQGWTIGQDAPAATETPQNAKKHGRAVKPA